MLTVGYAPEWIGPAQGKQFDRPAALDAGRCRRIAERHANGESMAALGKDYEVGVATIFRVLHP